MKRSAAVFFLALFLSSAAPNGSALDFWQYPEIADRHSLFLGVFAASFSFGEFFDSGYSLAKSFALYLPEAHLDYTLPFGLPFSLGVSVRAFDSEMFGVGVRPGYHFNFNNQNLDVYFVYAVNYVAAKDYSLLEWGGRLGLRYRFASAFMLCVETGFKVRTIYFGFSIKLN